MSDQLKLEQLVTEIEKLRMHLYQLTEAKGIRDYEVLVASQKLDAVLNEYCRLLKRKQDHKS